MRTRFGIAGGALAAMLSLTPAQAQDLQPAWITDHSSGTTSDFAFANAIAPDGLGNVYVTGSSFAANGLPDFTTIKYGSDGAVLWEQRYNGPADSWDAARDVAVDGSGNVYVTGMSFGPNDFDFLTIKYNPSGKQEWLARYDSPAHSEDWANALGVDSDGNVSVTGWSQGDGTFIDYLTVSYGPSGKERWAVRYNGPGNTKDRALALAVDGSGNVYVTGDSGEGSYNLSDYLTVKYNSAGHEEWVARYHNLYDYATAVAVDNSGNVYVTGYSYGAGTYYDYATIKYSPQGQQRWAARFHGGVGDDWAWAIGVDAAGDVVVTGESVGSGTGGDYGTVKYSGLKGKQVWAARYNGPGNAVDGAFALAIDGTGSIYVTGESLGQGTEIDYATIKYSSTGLSQSVTRYVQTTFDSASAIEVDSSGAVYVTGTRAYLGGRVWTTIKYVSN